MVEECIIWVIFIDINFILINNIKNFQRNKNIILKDKAEKSKKIEEWMFFKREGKYTKVHIKFDIIIHSLLFLIYIMFHKSI